MRNAFIWHNKKGDGMRKITIILFFMFFIQNIEYSQSIIFNKDSLYIDDEGFYDDPRDSLFIKNSGINELVIDSIYSNKIYSYPVKVYTKDTSYLFYIIFDQHPSPLAISPQDSIKLIFYMPDLCPICDGSLSTYFVDTLYFRSNALNTSTYLIYVSGKGFASDVNDENNLPKEYLLSQNYPNPFNPVTSIQYAVSQAGSSQASIGSQQFVTLKIYDVLGKEIATLVNEEKPAGEYEVKFDGITLPSGVYFYQLKAGSYFETKKMILLR
ncbi:MAG: hypothetical protein STSR0008_22620 [Ignavibacterium sp.]